MRREREELVPSLQNSLMNTDFVTSFTRKTSLLPRFSISSIDSNETNVFNRIRHSSLSSLIGRVDVSISLPSYSKGIHTPPPHLLSLPFSFHPYYIEGKRKKSSISEEFMGKYYIYFLFTLMIV